MVPYSGTVARSLVERRLTEVGSRLKTLREDLRVADEQLIQLADEADESRLRSLVSETPLAQNEHKQAERHALAMRRHREKVTVEITKLEVLQDELLDKFIEQNRDAG